MSDAEDRKQRLELLKMARVLLNETYINRRAEDHNKWLADSDVVWKERRVKLPYPAFTPYPTEEEIVAKALVLYGFINPTNDKTSTEGKLSEREAQIIADVANNVVQEKKIQLPEISPWEQYVSPKAAPEQAKSDVPALVDQPVQILPTAEEKENNNIIPEIITPKSTTDPIIEIFKSAEPVIPEQEVVTDLSDNDYDNTVPFASVLAKPNTTSLVADYEKEKSGFATVKQLIPNFWWQKNKNGEKQ